MGKRNYTYVQELLPEVEAMLAAGKTQREVVKHFGFRDKYIVKKTYEPRETYKQSWKLEFVHARKEESAKAAGQDLFSLYKNVIFSLFNDMILDSFICHSAKNNV